MKKCINCGADNEENASFCAECGHRFDETEPYEVTPLEKIIEQPIAEDKTADKKSNQKAIKIACACVGCIFVLFTLFNILVCTDVIKGKEGSAIEKYDNSIESFLKKNKTSEENDKTITESVTDEKSDVTIWNPDNETITNETTQITNETEPNNSGETYFTNVGNSHLFLRKEASTDSEKLDKIPNNTELIIYKIDGDWGYTKYNNKSGWVNMDYVEKKKNINDNNNTTSKNTTQTTKKTNDTFVHGMDYEVIDSIAEVEKKINIYGESVVIHKTTMKEMYLLDLFDDDSYVNKPLDGYEGGISFDFYSFMVSSKCKTYGDAVLYEIQSWDEEVEIIAADKEICLSKTTLKNLIDDGWIINNCYIEDYSNETEYWGGAVISHNNETFYVEFKVPMGKLSYENCVIGYIF